MTTVDEVVRDALASIDTEANAIAAAKWLDNRYKEMVSRVKFRHLRQVGELSLPAVIDTGTVSVDRGLTAVTGVTTTFQTDMGAGVQEYYYFRTNNAWYKIASVTNELGLVLASAFAEDDVAAGTYTIVKRHHPLASDARWVGDFYHTRLRQKLRSIGLDEMDMLYPGRSLVGNIPHYVAQVGVNTSGYLKYEIYPPPLESELIHYVYWTLPPSLTISSTIPSVIDPYTLKEGLLIDLYRYEKSVAIRKGNVNQAGIWRNDEKAQNTIWEKVIKDAIRTSRGSDDITFILEMFGSSHRSDQRTARDYVLDNWNR